MGVKTPLQRVFSSFYREWKELFFQTNFLAADPSVHEKIFSDQTYRLGTKIRQGKGRGWGWQKAQKHHSFKTQGVLPYKEVGGAWPQILPLKFLLEPQILPPEI